VITMSETTPGVQVDVFSKARTDELTSMEKIRCILDSVKEGNVVVLSAGLSSDEESRLVEKTMSEINPDNFTGIEIKRPNRTPSQSGGFFSKFVGSDDGGNDITFVAPADKIEEVDAEDGELLSALLHGE